MTSILSPVRMGSIGLREEGQQTMLDLDIIIVKTGILVLATLSVMRVVLHDFNSLRDDFKRMVPPRKRAKRARS